MKHVTSILVAGIGLAAIGVLQKMVGAGVDTSTAVFFRILTALLIIFTFIAATGRLHELKLKPRELPSFIIFGIVLGAGMWLYFAAVIHAPVSTVIIISFLSPVITAFLAIVLLKERASRLAYAGMLLAIFGAAIVVWEGLTFQQQYLQGYALATLMTVSGALGAILTKYESNKYTLSDVLFWPFLFASMTVGALALFQGITFSPTQFDLAVLLGIGTITAATYLAYDYGITELEAHTTSALVKVSSFAGAMVMAFILLGEGITLVNLLGGTVLIASAYLINKGRGKRLHAHYK